MIFLLPAVLPQRARGITLSRAVLPQSRGESKPKGYEELCPYPFSFPLSPLSQQQGSPAAPSPECRIRAPLPCSTPVGLIPTSSVCHGSRYCPVPPSCWLVFL